MKTSITASRQPWNKGKQVGQKAPLRLRDIWAIVVSGYSLQRKPETWLSSIWQSTASYGLATWSNCACGM